jgi:hypothetical protein
MMPQLPQPVGEYVRAVNSHDAGAFISLFDAEAIVDEIGREFRGIDAIKEWGNREIFAVQVTLDVTGCTSRNGETVFTAKVDGTFDRTGLPDPLIIAHSIEVKGDKIARLRCRLAENAPSN